MSLSDEEMNDIRKEVRMEFVPDLDEIATYETNDIQHDLALGLASGESPDEPLNAAFINELKKRGEPMPTNCKITPDVYALGGIRVTYDLEES